MDQEFKPTSFTAHDALSKAFKGARPKYAAGSVWRAVRNPGDRAFSSSFLDSLEGMEEIAGQNGMIMAKVNKLPFNECVTIHCMYYHKEGEYDEHGVMVLNYHYRTAIHAMCIVIESLLPSLTNDRHRKVYVSRSLGVQQGTQAVIAGMLGIDEDTFGVNFRRVRAIISELKERSMLMIEEVLVRDGIVLAGVEYE